MGSCQPHGEVGLSPMILAQQASGGLNLLLFTYFPVDLSKVLIPPSNKPVPWDSPNAPLASCRAQAESGSRGAVGSGTSLFSWCLRGCRTAGCLGYKLVGLQQQLLGFCPCFPSRLNGIAWTSWGWDPDTRDAWGVSSSQHLASRQPREPAVHRKYWTFWVLKREPGTVPRLHLIHLLGATERGDGESAKITLAGPGGPRASARHM